MKSTFHSLAILIFGAKIYKVNECKSYCGGQLQVWTLSISRFNSQYSVQKYWILEPIQFYIFNVAFFDG